MKLNIQDFYNQWGFYPIGGGDENADVNQSGDPSVATDANSTATGTDKPAGDQSQGQNGQQVRPEDFYNGKRLDEHPRFRQVNQRLREYADLGLTPAQIRELQSRANPVQKSNDPNDKAAIREKLRSELREIEPNIAVLERMQQEQQERHEAQYEEAVSKVDDYLNELKLEVNEDNNKLLQSILAQALHDNKRLAYRYSQGDLKVLDEVFDKFKKSFLEPMTRQGAATIQKNKQNQARLPVAPKGGSPAMQQEKPPANLKEASERAWERFQQVE